MTTTNKVEPTFIQKLLQDIEEQILKIGSPQEWVALIAVTILLALVIHKLFPKSKKKNKNEFLHEKPRWNNITNFLVYILFWSIILYLSHDEVRFNMVGYDDMIFYVRYVLTGLVISVITLMLSSNIILSIKFIVILLLPSISAAISYFFFSHHSLALLVTINLLVLAVSMIIYSEFSENFEEFSILVNESSKIVCKNLLPILTVIMITLLILTLKLFIVIPLIGYKGYYLTSTIMIYLMLNWSLNLMIGFNKVFISTLVVNNSNSNEEDVKKALGNAIQSIGTISYLSMVSAIISGFKSLLDKVIIFLESAKDTGSSISMLYNSIRVIAIYILKGIRLLISIFTYLIEVKTEVGLAYLGVYGNRKSIDSEAQRHYDRNSRNSSIVRNLIPLLRTMICYLSIGIFVGLQLFTGDINIYEIGTEVLLLRNMDRSILNMKTMAFVGSIYVMYALISSAYTATIALDVSKSIKSNYSDYEEDLHNEEDSHNDEDSLYSTKDTSYSRKDLLFSSKPSYGASFRNSKYERKERYIPTQRLRNQVNRRRR